MNIKAYFTGLLKKLSIPNLLAILFACFILIVCVYGTVHDLQLAKVDTEKITQEIFTAPAQVTFVEKVKDGSAAMLAQETHNEKIFWEVAKGSNVEVNIVLNNFSTPDITYIVRFGDDKVAIMCRSKYDPKPKIKIEEGMPFYRYEPVAYELYGNWIVWSYQWKTNFILGTFQMIFVTAVMVGLSWLIALVIFHVLFFVGKLIWKIFRSDRKQADAK